MTQFVKEFYKPITYADRIRSLSDEDLAVFFAIVKADLSRYDRPVRPYSGKDVNENYDWLKQQVPEEVL